MTSIHYYIGSTNRVSKTITVEDEFARTEAAKLQAQGYGIQGVRKLVREKPPERRFTVKVFRSRVFATDLTKIEAVVLAAELMLKHPKKHIIIKDEAAAARAEFGRRSDE